VRGKNKEQQPAGFPYLEGRLAKVHQIFNYRFQTGFPSASSVTLSYRNLEN
jgi:hypothetical protein